MASLGWKGLRCSGNSSWKITVPKAMKQHVHTYQTVVVSTSQAQSKPSYGLWLQAEDFEFRIKFNHCFIKIFIFVISEVSLDLSCALNVQPIQNYIQEHNIESFSFNYCSESSIMIRLWAEWSEVQTLVWTRDSSLLENIRTCSRASILVSG
jgi:hypothetical protein